MIRFISASFIRSSSYFTEVSGGLSSSLVSSSFTTILHSTIGTFDVNLTSSAIELILPSQSTGANNDINAFTISSSGNNPSIGIGTNTPNASLDVEEIEDSATGTRFLLKSARTNLGAQIGDAAGSIIFAIDSGSFNDVFSTGSVAEISTIVKETQKTGGSTSNMAGNLIFKSSPEFIENLIQVAEIGYFHFDNLNPSEDSEPGMVIKGQLTVGSGSVWQSQGGDVAFSVYNVEEANLANGVNHLKFRITGSNAVIHSGSLTIGSGSLFLGETYSGANQVEFLNLRGGGSIKLGHLSGGGGNHALEIYTANTLAAKFDNNQNLGIGTSTNTAPEKLTVEGNISSSGTLTGGGLNINGTTTFNNGNIDSVGIITLDSINDASSGGDTNIALTTTTLDIEVGGETFLQGTGTSADFSVDISAPNGSFSGNLTVEGDIIAENYIVSSSVTYMTQSFSNGSTIFGDTQDDTHLFTGSIDVTGSITTTEEITSNTFETISTTLASDSATNVDTFNSSSYNGAIYDYILKDTGVGARAGQFMVAHDGGSVTFTDTSTKHLTDSTIPEITADINGANVRVRVTNGNGYTFKSFVKKL